MKLRRHGHVVLAGVRLQHANLAVVGLFRLACAGYVSWLDDLIRREGTTWDGQSEVAGKPVVSNINGGDGLLLGVEPSLTAGLGAGVSLAVHATWTWGEERPPDAPARPLTRIPPLFGQLRLRWEVPGLDRWSLSTEAWLAAATRQERLSPEDEADVRIPLGGTPRWWTVNARAVVTSPDGVRVAAAAENLADATYKLHGSGVHGAGRGFVATLEVPF